MTKKFICSVIVSGSVVFGIFLILDYINISSYLPKLNNFNIGFIGIISNVVIAGVTFTLLFKLSKINTDLQEKQDNKITIMSLMNYETTLKEHMEFISDIDKYIVKFQKGLDPTVSLNTIPFYNWTMKIANDNKHSYKDFALMDLLDVEIYNEAIKIQDDFIKIIGLCFAVISEDEKNTYLMPKIEEFKLKLNNLLNKVNEKMKEYKMEANNESN